MKPSLQINHRDSMCSPENNFNHSFGQAWKHCFPEKVMLYVKRIRKKKKMENSDLAYCPAGVIPLGLVEQLIYLQGCYSLHKLKHSAIFIVLAYNV